MECVGGTAHEFEYPQERDVDGGEAVLRERQICIIPIFLFGVKQTKK